MTCKNSLELIIDEKKLLVNMNNSGTIVKMNTECECIQAKKWHNIYLHLSEDRLFLRLDDGKKYETKLEADKKVKINFDGFTRIGSFSGDVASLRMNLKEYALDKERSRSFTSPKKSKNNTYVIFKADSVNGIVGYSLFRGNSYVKIPVKANETLKVELVFLAISTDGVLFFNKGKTAGSYVYIVFIKGTMKMCVSIGKTKKCETILNINMYKWYSISLLVSGQKIELRVNEGSAFQVSFLENEYDPATPVCIGGGEKEDLFMYMMVIGIKEGFQGVIHEIAVNDKTFRMHAKPILNDMGIISSIGLTNPEQVNVAYEHQESEVKFRCDYTDFKEESGNSMVEWFKEDVLIQLSNLVKINHKLSI
ncbi:NRXN [Mytilus coruscus]|uniref:NRXN n=1 Tax=Mytilus coruscus TaxID=42192 RepID=A0A6J8A8K3_MYTCO|nr:NRXN [Mytilus coruscus]